MNTVITSKEAILSVSKQLAVAHGLQALNIRMVAEQCEVSVGSIYNYFPSKADLIADTVMTIWHDIFHNSASDPPLDSFVDCVVWFFNCVTNAAYTHFFSTHSLHFAHAETAKKRMEESFFHMKAGFLKALEDDPRVSPTAFSEEFTRVAFVDFVFSSLLSLLMKQESSCGVLLEIISRTIY